MIVKIPEKYELCLSYTWGPIPQGMCGHLFECIEYYYVLKNHFNCCIFIGEEISKDYIQKTIEDKYTFNSEEIKNLIDNIIIKDKPKILKGSNLLLTDGNFSKTDRYHLLFKKIMAFPCADKTFQKMNNIVMFQDDRIYGKSECKSIDYIKKILLSKYKEINKGNIRNNNLIYATKNARGLNEDYYKELENTYNDNFLLLTNTEIKSELSNRYIIEEMPVKNLMEKFNTYIYTPVGKKFDCSPRFLVECKFYGKDVIFHNIDYWEEDLGLKWRVHDIEHNFESLFLEEDDEIINLINDIIYNDKLK